MTVSINRTHKRYGILPGKRSKPTCLYSDIAATCNYKPVNPLDISNFKDIHWRGIEYNCLLERDGILYKFVEWLGHYPYPGIVVEEIGSIMV